MDFQDSAILVLNKPPKLPVKVRASVAYNLHSLWLLFPF